MELTLIMGELNENLRTHSDLVDAVKHAKEDCQSGAAIMPISHNFFLDKLEYSLARLPSLTDDHELIINGRTVASELRLGREKVNLTKDIMAAVGVNQGRGSQVEKNLGMLSDHLANGNLERLLKSTHGVFSDAYIREFDEWTRFDETHPLLSYMLGRD